MNGTNETPAQVQEESLVREISQLRAMLATLRDDEDPGIIEQVASRLRDASASLVTLQATMARTESESEQRLDTFSRQVAYFKEHFTVDPDLAAKVGSLQTDLLDLALYGLRYEGRPDSVEFNLSRAFHLTTAAINLVTDIDPDEIEAQDVDSRLQAQGVLHDAILLAYHLRLLAL